MTRTGSSRPSDADEAIALLSTAGELSEDALDNSLRAVAKYALNGQRELSDQHLLRRVFGAFIDGSNPGRQALAGTVLGGICQWHSTGGYHVASLLIPVIGLRPFIRALADMIPLPLPASWPLEGMAFNLMASAMKNGRREGNVADSRGYLLQHHPAVLKRSLEFADKIAEEEGPGMAAAALEFLAAAYESEASVHEGVPPFPPTPMPTFLWVGLWHVLIKCQTRPGEKMCWGVRDLISTHMKFVFETGSYAERAECLEALQKDVYPYVDTFAATLTSDADESVRFAAARKISSIFWLCHDFVKVIDVDYFACLADGPVQRLVRSPGALEAFAATATKAMGSNKVALIIPLMLAVCGHRSEVYRSRCISIVSDFGKPISKIADENLLFCAYNLPFIVGSDTDLTGDRAKIAVCEGLPAAMCQMLLELLKRQIRQDYVEAFVYVAIGLLKALVSYGDRVSSRGGTFRPNSVTQAILQHDSVKTMRAAGRQPGRRKGHQQHLTVPKELVELFDEIDKAANERAEANLAAELADDHIDEGQKNTNISTSGSGSRADKRRSKGKRGGRGANSTKTTDNNEMASSSSVGADNIDVEPVTQEHEEDTEDFRGFPGPPSPSPPSPPRPSCSYSSSSASVPSAISGSMGGGRGQQQQGAGGGGDDGGGFITVGRKKRGGKGTGGNALQQQTNTADKRDDNSRVFPSSSSSESTRPSSSHSSVSGGPHNAPALPFPLPPRPAAPPPQPPNRHTPTPTPAPSTSRAGCDEQGLAPLAAGGRSSQDRCDGEVSELELMRQQLEAMRLEREAILKEKEDIKREKDRLEESTECDICMASKKSIVLIPCRHFCLCGACAAALMSKPVAQRLCRRCRQAITDTRHVYL
ncbi:unnamed protein product [Vitrella brassicaformis CCMP3155]|uniref:RING-type domain-containing protein n=1 Tax=Vitrella brassicaformis (strain CCMP3155) TaxID=1169540 RepID=A0A0G4FNR2_VITBC|nr:unnamed protein product [Vitrella brassicaformis CCMP3155]|eukprot:CEM15383.1 unnamed protein product [Vitrella brassicaformis CCMP3155]